MCCGLQCVQVSYHGQCHAVNLMFVFGLVLSEGTVPEQERERERETVTGDFWEGGVGRQRELR